MIPWAHPNPHMVQTASQSVWLFSTAHGTGQRTDINTDTDHATNVTKGHIYALCARDMA